MMKHEKAMIKGDQFCLNISNDGVTTEHKLHGCTLFWLAVFNFYGLNWVYVILSRLRTLQGGLFLSKLLDYDPNKCQMSRFMKQMIDSFQQRIGLQIPTPKEYQMYMDLDRASNQQDRGVQDDLVAGDRDNIRHAADSEAGS
jgi:hypothetical protein